MLRIRDVHAGYGATPILFGVSLEVRPDEAVALLGKNGMGFRAAGSGFGVRDLLPTHLSGGRIRGSRTRMKRR